VALFTRKNAMMLIVDAHQDIAYNALCWGRDYRQNPLHHRAREAHLSFPPATIGLPDALLGRVGVVFASIFTAPDNGKPSKLPYERPTYRNAKEAYSAGMRQMDYYHRLADEEGKIVLIRDKSDLESVLQTWQPNSPLNARKQGLVISFEGADPITEPRQFEEWYERGVRVVGLAWGQTRYSGGTGFPSGLSREGFALLDVLNAFNVIVDLAHSSEKAFYETLDAYQGAVIASHANPRHFCDTDRHLSDKMIRRLAERDGVMGVVLCNPFLSSRWSNGDPKSKVPLTIVADVVDYVCQLTGSAQHIGIGSDFDGGFGANAIPEHLDTVGDLLKIADVLKERGYTEADILAIMGENFLRPLKAILR
jgi:membrane dipeptidase